jgi:hypothetical protein
MSSHMGGLFEAGAISYMSVSGLNMFARLMLVVVGWKIDHCTGVARQESLCIEQSVGGKHGTGTLFVINCVGVSWHDARNPFWGQSG